MACLFGWEPFIGDSEEPFIGEFQGEPFSGEFGTFFRGIWNLFQGNLEPFQGIFRESFQGDFPKGNI